MSAAAAAVAAGLVAILVSLAVERFGGRVGGVLGSVPTTIVPLSIGLLRISESAASFQNALAMAPAGMLLNAGFLWLWRHLPPRLAGIRADRRLAWVTVLSLGAWLGAAVIVVVAGRRLLSGGQPLLPLGWALAMLLSIAGVLACRGRRPAPRASRAVSPVTLLARGALAAAAVGGASLLAHHSPLAAGMAGVFPAIFLTTMVSLWLAQGEAVPLGAVGPLMLGSTSVAVYALLSATLMPRLGALAGAAGAWLSAVGLITVPALIWQGRQGAPPEATGPTASEAFPGG